MFDLTFEHKYSMQDIESLIPFERDIYIHLINERIEERKRQAEHGE